MDSLQKITAVKKSRLNEEILSQLQQMILNGDFVVGERLPAERELAQAFGVNRGTIREAITKLELLELIEVRHGFGNFVKDFSHSSNLELINTMLNRGERLNLKVVKNILAIRKIVVPEMAYLVASCRTQKDLDEMEQIIFQQPTMAIMERDIAISNIIARASGNMLYTVLLNFFTKAGLEVWKLFFDNEKNREDVDRYHRNLFAAIQKQESQESRDIVFKGLENAEQYIVSKLEKDEMSSEKQ